MASVIKIPEELARELDRLAGAEKKTRTAYVVDLLWRDVRRHQQRAQLHRSAGAWHPADHPELAEGAAAYVDRIRAETDPRLEAALRHRR